MKKKISQESFLLSIRKIFPINFFGSSNFSNKKFLLQNLLEKNPLKQPNNFSPTKCYYKLFKSINQLILFHISIFQTKILNQIFHKTLTYQ